MNKLEVTETNTSQCTKTGYDLINWIISSHDTQ